MAVRSVFTLAILISGTSTSDLDFDHAKLQGVRAVAPRVTRAPSPQAVRLELAKRQSTDDFRVPDCATSCLSSAVINHTNCDLFDHMCTCDIQNGAQIYAAAQPCLDKACGYTNDVLYMLSGDCVTYLRTASTETTTTQTRRTSVAAQATSASKTTAEGSVVTVTRAIIYPTGSSSTSSPPPSNQGSHGLSKGAVAGIAVGTAIGGSLIIARIAFRIFRCMGRESKSSTPAAGESAPPVTETQPLGAEAKAELPSQAKPGSPFTVSTMPVSAVSSSPGPGSPRAPNPSVVSSPMAREPSPSVLPSHHHSQQAQLYQAVPGPDGGFVMVPVQSSAGGAVEIGNPGRDMGPVEVTGESRQHELPIQVYGTGPYEMPAARGR